MSTPTPADPAPLALVPAAPVRLDEHPAAVYLARLAPSGRRSQRAALARIVHVLVADCGVAASRCECPLRFPWHALRYQHAAAARAALSTTLGPASVRKHLAALKAVSRECWRLGLTDAEAHARLQDVEAPRGEAPPAGRSLSAKERARLYAACADDQNRAGGARDACLLALLDGLGLRRTAVVALDLADVDLDGGTLRVRKDKGQKGRKVPLVNGAAEAVRDWLAVRGDQPGPLLFAVNKGGRALPRRVSSQCVYDVLRRRTAQAGIARCSPHDLRRTLVGDLLDAGADLAVVSQLVGHSSVTTTARYDRRGERAKQQAVALRAVPYVPERKRRPSERSGAAR